MFTIAATLVIVSSCVLMLLPLGAHLALRRRVTAILALYYALLLLPIGMKAAAFSNRGILVISPWLRTLPNGFWDGLTLAVISLLVLTPAYLVLMRAAQPRNLCPNCLYDLRGNLSGVCPECGQSIDSVKPGRSCTIARKRHRRLLMVGAAAAFVLVPAIGVRQNEDAYFCTNCARLARAVSVDWEIPWPALRWGICRGSPRARPLAENAVTAYLDPGGQCIHTWRWFSGETDQILFGGCRSSGSQRPYVMAADEPEFGQYLSEHPEVIDRIRAALRTSDPINSWLSEAFYTWRGDYGPNGKVP